MKKKNIILTDFGIDKIEKLAIQKRIKNNNFYDPANLIWFIMLIKR